MFAKVIVPVGVCLCWKQPGLQRYWFLADMQQLVIEDLLCVGGGGGSGIKAKKQNTSHVKKQCSVVHAAKFFLADFYYNFNRHFLEY